MPREVIAGSNDPELKDIKRLVVSWGAEGKSLDPVVTLGGWIHEESEDGAQADWSPETVWALNRADTNKLIRTLRKARDQAYGRDE